MSRSASEPDSVSLRLVKAASLSKVRKPEISGEVMGASSRWAFRDGWGRRAGTDRSRKLGDPAGWERSQQGEGRHNLIRGPGRESDRLIVAKKRLIPVERRGRSRDMLREGEE